MVVMRESQLRQLCLDHLNDTTTYEQLKNDPTNTIRINVNKNFNRIFTDRPFPKAMIRNLQTPSTAKMQHFYALPKTHKKNTKNTTHRLHTWRNFDRLGWFLQQILKPLLKHVASTSTTPTISPLTIQQHWQKQPQRHGPCLLWRCRTLHKHQHHRSSWNCTGIHNQTPHRTSQTRNVWPFRTSPSPPRQQHFHLQQHTLQTNSWTCNCQPP